MLDDLFLVIAKVIPHRDLLKAEDPQRTLVEDLPVLLVTDGIVNAREVTLSARSESPRLRCPATRGAGRELWVINWASE